MPKKRQVTVRCLAHSTSDRRALKREGCGTAAMDDRDYDETTRHALTPPALTGGGKSIVPLDALLGAAGRNPAHWSNEEIKIGPQDLTAGMVCRNPKGEEPFVFCVDAVGRPDAANFVPITTCRGERVMIAAEDRVPLFTAQDAEIEGVLTDGEADRLAIATKVTSPYRLPPATGYRRLRHAVTHHRRVRWYPLPSLADSAWVLTLVAVVGGAASRLGFLTFLGTWAVSRCFVPGLIAALVLLVVWFVDRQWQAVQRYRILRAGPAAPIEVPRCTACHAEGNCHY
jgi:hypothetical protein